jgi:HPr kinase/phosphorylase
MLLHGSCAARGADAVLLLGPPGSGKSDLALRLIHDGWRLVADDQVEVNAVPGRSELQAAAPAALRGMLEVRGLGIFRNLTVAEPPTSLRLVVRLAAGRAEIARLPEPERWDCAGIGVPIVTLHAFDASAHARVALALDAATGVARQVAGAFADDSPPPHPGRAVP